MEAIKISKENLINGAIDLGGGKYKLAAAGSGFLLPEVTVSKQRYLAFTLEFLEEHSGVFELQFFGEDDSEPKVRIRFGVLPGVEASLCFDLNWLSGDTLFPDHRPGALKVVCHGSRIDRDELKKVVLTSYPCFHDLTVTIKDVCMRSDIPPAGDLNKKMVDPFGQSKGTDWKGKIKDEEHLSQRLNTLLTGECSPPSGWNKYGGSDSQKLTEGTGFFSRLKKDNRWYLVDPSGHAFFSVGPDCVRLSSDGRIDNIENMLDWLPAPESEEYKLFVRESFPAHKDMRDPVKSISFSGLNLYRVWGDSWYTNWSKMVERQLPANGLNTLGNWSDDQLLGKINVPYVTSLAEFPETKQRIFRDFPDVLSAEYRENAEKCAQSLNKRKDDPLMIGYFLRNEPNWAFVDDLMIADEVLYNPADTVCKQELIRFLKDKYGDIGALNTAYGLKLAGFEDLNKPTANLSHCSPIANEDMREFSRRLLRAYIEIPANACRAVDPNHMILGMRWAWISNPDLISGWEVFDVFSINCYAVDPTFAIDIVRDLGVDLPVMIGEFHHGALDAGLTATGLEGVKTQRDRGIAYRYYCERVAAHPYGVGCHYFQMYDQFPLGRFDGENYNIGLFDVCSQPYEDMMGYVQESGQGVYDIMSGNKAPSNEKAQSIPMIAY